MLVVAARWTGLTWAEPGLGRRRLWAGLRWGGACFAAVVLALTVAVAVPASRPLLTDARTADSTAGDVAAEVLVRIPLGTVLWEEVAFRGVLLFSSITGGALTESVAGHLFDDIERAIGLTVSPHSLRHYFGASLVSRGVSGVAVSRWLGHSGPEITYRVYAYLKPDDELATRAAMADLLSRINPDVYPLCTRETSE